MTETMYDRLGELLSETLREGKVKFVKVREKNFSSAEEENSSNGKFSSATENGNPRGGNFSSATEGGNPRDANFSSATESGNPRDANFSSATENGNPRDANFSSATEGGNFQRKKNHSAGGTKKSSAKKSRAGENFQQSRKKFFDMIQKNSELERAFRILGVDSSCTKEQLKKAYKEKLKYFHPDKYQENAVLQKVATDKTRQVVSSYEMILRELFEK